MYCLFLSLLLRLEKVTSCSSQHRCLCSAPGQEQCWSLHLGLKQLQLQLPYLKFGRGRDKSRSIPHWSMLLVWCYLNLNKIWILKCTQSCSISDSLYPAEFRSKNCWDQERCVWQICCFTTLIEPDHYSVTFFCLCSALNMRIWCLGSKIGLVTGYSKSCFQVFLTKSGA